MAAALLFAAAAVLAQDAPRGPLDLRPGEFLWHPEVSPAGPVVLVVSLDEQRAYVYRNGVAIGLSTISSGKPGHETPAGVFTILQKNRDHRSNLYNNAPMPYMQRLTWDGIALHGGALPGYPASHGCVRLPQAFAQKLFGITRNGDTVVVADAKASPTTLVYPAVIAPVTAQGAPLALPESGGAGYTWDEAAAPQGQVGIVVSLADRRIYVLRDGRLLGEAVLETAAPEAAFGGTTLFVMGQGVETEASPLDPSRPRHAWTAYPILAGLEAAAQPGAAPMRASATREAPPAAAPVPLDLLRRPTLPVRLPPEFTRRLYDALVPGTTLLVTDLPAIRPAVPAHAAPELQPVLESDAGAPAP
ncbi:hypothetical protein B1992_01610 [Pseudoxanthomonas broegbernensis]|uniref:L,D-TPase catalytic domain-containing protein n=1 Tax=Pseudoxanthomonas broegbernensis TaxID=83619 RepID=A0A7V8K8F5_9GAMM|nr:hypothetical protein B1992_01610 [Pseudoxanthomonas broegbernensis]